MHKLPLTFRVIASLLTVAALLVLAMPRTVKLGYEYKRGQAWKYETLVARFDFPVFKTEEQMLREKENLDNGIIPYYKYSEETVLARMKALEALDFGSFSYLKPALSDALSSIFDKGVVPDQGVRQAGQPDPSGIMYIQRNKRAVKVPVSEVYTLTSARTALAAKIPAQADSVLAAAGIYDLISPNLTFDQTTTNLVHSESPAAVSPTMGYVNAGQLIVSNGEIVTAEIEQMLDSYRKEYDSNIGYDGPKVLYWLGNILIALAMVVMLFFAMFIADKRVFQGNGYYYVLVVFTIFAAGALLVARLGYNFLYLVPFSLAALLLQAFFRGRLIIPVYTVALLPLLIFTHSGIVLFTMNLLAGMVAVYGFKYLGRGWKQFINALVVYAVLMAVYMGFRLLGMVSGDFTRVAVFLFIGSMLNVAGYPLIFLFEKIFNLVSTSRLEELSNHSNPLLRKLELLSPGTFQHSIQVMNMCVAATRAIGGDVPLVRAGALYHDIGKMKNPQCFVENESLVTLDEKSKYHASLDPHQSARDIINHVNDGIELAQHANMPSVVVDFIRTHHGTTLVSFFYDKFVNAGGDPSLKEDFRYTGGKPHSKEQIILMICDTVEAASRTLKSYDSETFDAFVENIVSSKMEQGQFDQADITLREIGIVKSVLKSHLAQIYHERIAYPNRKIN